MSRGLGKIIIAVGAAFWVALAVQPAGAVPIVSNVQMEQIEGTKLVRITYDVTDNVNTVLWATVSISTNGIPLPVNSVTGDVQCSMSPGNGKTIIWDAGADWNGRYTEIAEAVVDVRNNCWDPESVCVDCNLAFSYSGSGKWTTDRSVYKSPNLSMRSGAISHNQSTSIKTTVTGPGTLFFHWKVSSEANCDKLGFYVNGTRVTDISGSVDWKEYGHGFMGSSTYVVEWRYSKDGSGSSGSDCGWIDDVSWRQ